MPELPEVEVLKRSSSSFLEVSTLSFKLTQRPSTALSCSKWVALMEEEAISCKLGQLFIALVPAFNRPSNSCKR